MKLRKGFFTVLKEQGEYHKLTHIVPFIQP